MTLKPEMTPDDHAAHAEELLETARPYAFSAPAKASLERQAPDGSWSVIGLDRGKAPVVAAPADGTPWRAAVWPVDQEPVRRIGDQPAPPAP